MIICLAALESVIKSVLEKFPPKFLKYGLVSYLYINNNSLKNYLSKVQYTLIDSGAHSFQHGMKVDIDNFCEKYVNFIKENNKNEQILGFFELDVDNIYGYEKVLELRKKLEEVSDKIIPVWHNNGGIDDFIDMCKKYGGKRIAITGFLNNDIKDSQYNFFINTAHKYNCKIHILGLTRFDLINSLNLGLEDSVDSSTWKQTAIFGSIRIPLQLKTI